MRRSSPESSVVARRGNHAGLQGGLVRWGARVMVASLLQGVGGSEPVEMAQTQPLPLPPRPLVAHSRSPPPEEPFSGRGLRGAQGSLYTHPDGSG